LLMLGTGIRVGYGSFPLGIVEYLWRAKQPYNVSVAAETAACAALSNPAYLERVRDALVQERGRLMAVLEGVSFLQPYPSASNFILCKVTALWCRCMPGRAPVRCSSSCDEQLRLWHVDVAANSTHSVSCGLLCSAAFCYAKTSVCCR
jgi:histidinol-phosphate/aromatic aminotransferase/cobyric acid decarboxylase-like protein